MSQKIVVVEDDINIAELLRLYLEKDGFEVLIAHDGGAGLHLAETEKPDLVMLDIMLPGMDGWQVCKRLREKLEGVSDQWELKTVWGVGYKFMTEGA